LVVLNTTKCPKKSNRYLSAKFVTILRLVREIMINTSQPVNISLVTNTSKYDQKVPYHMHVSVDGYTNTEEAYTTIRRNVSTPVL